MHSLTLAVFMVMTPLAAKALELNTANRAQLEALRGVGVEGAERILVERDKRPYADWADFMRRVKGVKRGMARRFSNAGLTVNLLPFEPLPVEVPHPKSPTVHYRGPGLPSS